MELVIDVGNTETVLGIVDPGTLDLRAHWRLSTTIPRTPDEYGLVLRSLLRDGGIPHDDLTMTVLGSVVPAATRILTDTLERIVGEAPIVVDARTLNLNTAPPSPGVELPTKSESRTVH